ncbi:Protein KTI12-like [Vitis vinifera]|uniref:Protein KTI12-like n=1 Tax=Vitis vinifera TaxID=29760 RepID=A0A438E357_VITVI|nr:Protein KTI12-like [Vitis vinifera]
MSVLSKNPNPSWSHSSSTVEKEKKASDSTISLPSPTGTYSFTIWDYWEVNCCSLPRWSSKRLGIQTDGQDSIIIVDSLNSIKGYRYELWCLARAAGIRYCVLFCDVEESHCRTWNEQRSENGEASYDDKIFEDLVRRFEKPDRRNRWDSPLFELWPFRDGIEKSSAAISDAVSYLTKKADSKTRDIKILQPTIATKSARFSEANSLYEMDRATQEIINAIVEAQSQAVGGPVNGISLGQGLAPINISKSVGLPELRRLRRTFIKLTGQTSLSGPPPPSDSDSAKRMFVDYLNRELGSA